MDCKNRFETRNTFLMYRLEYFGLLLISVGLAALHIDQIRWLPFAVLFLYIDVIGYLPGAIAFRRGQGKVSRIYYYLYNTTHNFLTNLVVAGLWCVFVGPEWALLAIPIHLFGDRSLFGNSMKSTGVSFEPNAHPAFRRFEASYAEADRKDMGRP
jgi:hypothetical protein